MHACTQDVHPGIALRDYCSAQLTGAIADLALRGRHVHGGIHRARRAIRRTRAALRLAMPTLEASCDLVDRRLRRINRRLSPLRDAQALVETLDRLEPKAHGKTRKHLERARRIAARQRKSVARDEDTARVLKQSSTLLDALRTTMFGAPWESLEPAAVRRVMSAARRRARALREYPLEHDDTEAWHRWRRQLRRVSDQHLAAEAMGLDAIMPPFDRCLLERLGLIQDLSLLVGHCREDSPFPAKTRKSLKRFGKRHLARQRERVRSVLALTAK